MALVALAAAVSLWLPTHPGAGTGDGSGLEFRAVAWRLVRGRADPDDRGAGRGRSAPLCPGAPHPRAARRTPSPRAAHWTGAGHRAPHRFRPRAQVAGARHGTGFSQGHGVGQ